MRDAAAQVLATPPGFPLEHHSVSESPRDMPLEQHVCPIAPDFPTEQRIVSVKAKW